jgi:hypothetical protein
MQEKKKCSKCGKTKPVSEFHRDKRTPWGRLYKCKLCVNADSREWGRANRARKVANTQKWRKQNPDKVKSYAPKKKMWKKNNHDKVRAAGNKANRKVRNTPKGRLNHKVGNLIRLSLRGTKAGWHWEALVGYTLEQLMRHLEKHFLPGMSWGNMGEWHVDHKVPIAAFNFKKPEDLDFKRCWALNNLQPLWAIDNIKKKDKIEKPFQPSLTLAL